MVGHPWAGWFFPNVTSYTRWQHHLPSNRTNKPLFLLYQSYVNEECAQDNKDEPWLCGPAAVQQTFPYIRSRVFVAQNMFDSDQLFAHLGCPRQVCAQPLCIHILSFIFVYHTIVTPHIKYYTHCCTIYTELYTLLHHMYSIIFRYHGKCGISLWVIRYISTV